MRKSCKLLIYPLLLVFLMVGISYSGLEDRSSDITLRKAPHNYVLLPDVVAPSEALTGTPPSGWFWMYVDNSNLYLKDADGNTDILSSSATYRYDVALASVFVDTSGPITNATAPNLTTLDNVGAIVYDNSLEVTEIQFPWTPSGGMTGMAVKLICSSSADNGTTLGIDWGVFIHGNDVDYPTVTAQDRVALTSTTLDGSEELVTLTLNSTGVAAVTPGTNSVTIAIWNSSTTATTQSTEIKAIWIEETIDL